MKPCIGCGKNCEILPVQLGDFFTLTLLRVCSGDCMFMVAYEFMRSECIHKQFRNWLHDKQNEEDKKSRDELVHEVTEDSLKRMREDLEANPNLLSMPVPNLINEMFGSGQSISSCSGKTMRFTRPSIEDRIKWQSEHVYNLKLQLQDDMTDLEKLENEGKK